MDRLVIKVGIWGLGRIGHGFGVSADGDPLSHSEAYARAEDAAIVAGVDPFPAARRVFAARFPRARVVAKGGQLPPGLRLDVASIATATEAHESAVDEALAAGARVLLLEKPVAPSRAAAGRIAARCRAAGAAVVVNYSRRWTPMLAALRSVLAEGGPVGPPSGATIRYTGGLVHNGTHWIDLLSALMGPPIEARPAPFGGEPDGHLNAGSLVLRFASGAIATLVNVTGVSWSAGEGELWSPEGLARFWDGGSRVSLQRRAPSTWPGFQALGPAELLVTDGAGLRGHVSGAVAEALALARPRANRPPTCGLTEGLAALALAEDARSAA
jgi:predicted dehydrogenase